MQTDLWNYCLNLYARPGVEQACLDLQSRGMDVCLLLCGAWLERRGVAHTPERVQALQQIAHPWQVQVVEPLRQMRVQWRALAQQDAQLASLREQIKTLELEAERTLLARLEALAQTWPINEVVDQQDWLEGLATEAANRDHDALLQLRVMATNT